MNNRIVRLLLLLALMVSFVAIMPAAAQEDDTTIVVGTNAEYPPFESVDEDGEIVGFDIDLINAIAADAGLEVEFVNTRWDGIFTALASGEFDVVISAATITEEREEEIDFTDPYFNAGQMIAVSADMAEDVETPEDLAGLRVGVQLGTTGDEYASAIDGVEVVRFDEITLAFQALGAGDVDAIINDAPVSADIIANNPDLNAVLVGEPLTDEFYGIAVNPELSELLDALNVSLANVIASGEYAEIYNEWFGFDPPSDFMPADEEEVTFEVDFADPASVVTGLFFTAFNAPTVEALAGFFCPEALEAEDMMIGEEDLAQLEGIGVDLSQMELEVTEADGEALVTFGGQIGLIVDGETSFMPIEMLTSGMEVEELRLVQDDEGNWSICPAAEEE